MQLLFLLLLLLPLIHQLLVSFTLSFEALMVVKHCSSAYWQTILVNHVQAFVCKTYTWTSNDLFLHLGDEVSYLLLCLVFYLFVGLLPLHGGFLLSVTICASKVWVETVLAEGRCIWLSCYGSYTLHLLQLAVFLGIPIFIRLFILRSLLFLGYLKCVELVTFFNRTVKLSTPEVAGPCLILNQRRLRVNHRRRQVHSLILLRGPSIDIGVHQFDPLTLLLQLSNQLTDSEFLNGGAGFTPGRRVTLFILVFFNLLLCRSARHL